MEEETNAPKYRIRKKKQMQRQTGCGRRNKCNEKQDVEEETNATSDRQKVEEEINATERQGVEEEINAMEREGVGWWGKELQGKVRERGGGGDLG